MSSKNKGIVIADVCGTLFFSNTTFDFILYYHKQKKSFFLYIYCLFWISIIGKIFNRLFRGSLRNKFIKTLQNEKSSELLTVSSLFYNDVLLNKKNKIAFDILEKYQSDNYNIVLASASINPVISVIASKLDVDFFSTQLSFTDGVCDGKIAEDIKGNKHSLFCEHDIYCVLTDNLDDLILCQNSEKAIVFSKHKNLAYWRKNLTSETYNDEYKIYVV